MPERIPLYYTFGNHHHWVDMEWLWGYKVTPDSVRDMLFYCQETGAKGNVNFDGVGYEKMAAECPEALAELKEAIAKGLIEPVGCSYGQPYGLFHGGESNIRQRVYGVRAVMRLLGTRPRTFWEEEFDFFPQLPQILKGCGFENASLYFQWTWHTPEVPKEEVPVVWWEAPDGSRLLTATRNRMNLHQWPEDFAILLDELAEGRVEGWKGVNKEGATPPPPASEEEGAGGGGLQAERAVPAPSTLPHVHPPLVLQWLELIPSPDWMCRAELMIPMLKKLKEDPRFEVKMGTLGEYLRGIADSGFRISDSGTAEDQVPGLGSGVRGGKEVAGGRSQVADDLGSKSEFRNPQSEIPVRRYTMDQVWHGMSLGKNGDRMRRKSRRIEHQILKAESLAAINGLFGRPYAQWDVYPTWELEEAWRELLQAQHHDNDECEGLCGRVGEASYERADFLSQKVLERQMQLLCARVAEPGITAVDFNPLGWARASHFDGVVPAFGFARKERWGRPIGFEIRGDEGWLEAGDFRVVVDIPKGRIRQMWSKDFPEGIFEEGYGFPFFTWMEGAEQVDSSVYRIESAEIENTMLWLHFDSDKGFAWIHFSPVQERDALDVEVWFAAKPDPGMNAAITMPVALKGGFDDLIGDTPLSIDVVRPTPSGLKKYPSGDWMTSPQWFETVKDAFTCSTFVDLLQQPGTEAERGLMVVHDGNQQWFKKERDVACILSMNDPWDESYYETDMLQFRLIPHGRISHSERFRVSQEALRWVEHDSGPESTANGDLPVSFAGIGCSPSNVVPTAFYREEEYYSGRDLENYAGRGMGYPYVIRLVEFDGLESEVELTLPGPIAMAFKTNLMGEIEAELEAVAGEAPSLVLRSESEGLVGGGDPDTLESRNPQPPTSSPSSDSVETPRRGAESFVWQTLRFTMRPYEIATIYADLVSGRKQFRDLDAMRKVWATVHRVEE